MLGVPVRHTALFVSSLLLLGMLGISPAAAAPKAVNIEHLDNVDYGERLGGEGTDSDFIEMLVPQPDGTSALRSVGVFGSINGGARVMDVTDGIPVELGFYDCKIGQGDVQVFQRGEGDATRTYFTFTDDGYSGRGGSCQQWGQVNRKFTETREGTFLVDITDPATPTTVNFVPFPLGSHNMTVHPSSNYLYNSNSELITNAVNAGIEIYDIADLENPVDLGTLALPVRPGLGTDSHDITFNTAGTRAYSAALSHTVIIDTTDAAKPKVLTSIEDPAINVEHQANAVTLTDPILGKRDFLIIEDEFAGAAGADQTCPSGGTHVYDVTGPLETAPVKVGTWYVDDVTNTNAVGLTSCTAHVFDIHEEEAIMTMSFYGGGIRVIDLSSLVGVSLGANGAGIREIGMQRFDDSNSWSVKAPKVDVAEDGTISAFLYSNDIDRGLDTFRFEGTRASFPAATDTWLSGTTTLADLGGTTMASDYRPFCLLKGESPAKLSAALDKRI